MSDPRLAALAFAAALLVAPAPAPAADAARSSYSCVVNGKKIVSDRLIPECANTEQRELNADGSLKRTVPPTPTDDERAEAERRERDRKVADSTRNEAIRRDRNLMQRFPDEAAHRKARSKALDEFDVSVRNYQSRIALLKNDRKKLEEEAAFYGPAPKQPMPVKLKQQLDANDASLEAQSGLVQNQQIEIVRINALYDAELARLKRLWAGAPAGSLGPLPSGPQVTMSAEAVKAATAK